MGTSFTDGNTTTDGTEQNIFGSDVSGEGHYATKVFLHNMQSGDSLTIKVYAYDTNATTMRLVEQWSFDDAQTLVCAFIPFIPCTQYRVTIQRTAGTDRNYTWERTDVTT